MYDFESLNRSESLSDLPQTLQDQIEADMDFDPFAPLGNSNVKTIQDNKIPQLTSKSEDSKRLEAMNKIGFHGHVNLTEIIEEISEMEVSEFDLTKLPSTAYLKGLESTYRLEDLIFGNDKPLFSNRSKIKEEDYNRTSLKYDNVKFFPDEVIHPSPFSKSNTKNPSEAEKIQIFTPMNNETYVNNNNLEENNKIQENDKDKIKIINDVKEAKFIKKNENKRSSAQNKDLNSINNKTMNYIDETKLNDINIQSNKHLSQSINDNISETKNSNFKSKISDKDSVVRSIDSSTVNKTEKYNTPKQGKTASEYDSERKENKRSSLFIDLYGRGNQSDNNKLNIYKRRNTSKKRSEKMNVLNNNSTLSKIPPKKCLYNKAADPNVCKVDNKDNTNKRKNYKAGLIKFNSNKKIKTEAKVNFKTSSNLSKIDSINFKKKKHKKNSKKPLKSIMSPTGYYNMNDNLSVSTNKCKPKVNSVKKIERMNFYTSVDNLKNNLFINNNNYKHKFISDFSAGKNIYSTLNNHDDRIKLNKSAKDIKPLKFHKSTSFSSIVNDKRNKERNINKSIEMTIKNNEMKKYNNYGMETYPNKHKNKKNSIPRHSATANHRLFNNLDGLMNKDIAFKTMNLKSIHKKTIGNDTNYYNCKSMQLKESLRPNVKCQKAQDSMCFKKNVNTCLEKSKSKLDKRKYIGNDLLSFSNYNKNNEKCSK